MKPSSRPTGEGHHSTREQTLVITLGGNKHELLSTALPFCTWLMESTHGVRTSRTAFGITHRHLDDLEEVPDDFPVAASKHFSHGFFRARVELDAIASNVLNNYKWRILGNSQSTFPFTPLEERIALALQFYETFGLQE